MFRLQRKEGATDARNFSNDNIVCIIYSPLTFVCDTLENNACFASVMA